MSRWSIGVAIIVAVLSGGAARAYEDDDLLCRPGWSPELLHQQMMEQYDQQRAMQAQYQYAIIQRATERKNQEAMKSARRARLEKEARKREELIAKRKSENAKQNAVGTKTASKTSSPN